MSRIRLLIAGAAVIAMTLSGIPDTEAQQKQKGKAPPRLPEIKEVDELPKEIRQVRTPEELGYRHGERLALTLKDGDVVAGHVIFADTAEGILYMRQRPGMPPLEIPFGQISQTSKAIRPAALDNDKGKVVPAGVTPAGIAPRREPTRLDPENGLVDGQEIFTRTVRQGPMYIETYYAPGVSDSERAILRKLEDSWARVARLEDMVTSMMQTQAVRSAVQQEILTQQDAQTRSFRLYNNLMTGYRSTVFNSESYRWSPFVFSNFGPFMGAPFFGGAGGAAAAAPIGAAVPAGAPPVGAAPFDPRFANPLFAGAAPFGFPTYTVEGQRGVNIGPAIERVYPIIAPVQSELLDVGQVAAELKQAEVALADARRDLEVTLASHGVFDRGRLVAVRTQPREDIAALNTSK